MVVLTPMVTSSAVGKWLAVVTAVTKVLLMESWSFSMMLMAKRK
jgi:hypothetical protein